MLYLIVSFCPLLHVHSGLTGRHVPVHIHTYIHIYNLYTNSISVSSRSVLSNESVLRCQHKSIETSSLLLRGVNLSSSDLLRCLAPGKDMNVRQLWDALQPLEQPT